MASFLRQLVAGPRKGHSEAGLDLCYVTDHIIATSGPSQTYPRRAYRNPLDQLVSFLDAKHGDGWAIWEFRAEGTGYPDELVYDRIHHYPFPDHHPPPFKLMPLILSSMRNWLHGGPLHPSSDAPADPNAVRDEKRVIVVHCKAGKGRSGTASVSYLIAEEGWTAEDALARFTERRMRKGFGAGVSIPSQLRWVGYVDRWTRAGKVYRERPVEIVEIHAWGLRNGVKVDVEGFMDDGKRIQTFHTFKKNERHIVEGDAPDDGSIADLVWDMAGYPPGSKAPAEADFADAANNDNATDSSQKHDDDAAAIKPPNKSKTELITETPKPVSAAAASRASTFSATSRISTSSKKSESEPGGMAVIFRPAAPIRIQGCDVNIAIERRNRTHKAIGLTMVSAVAHVWFNAFFEGRGPERGGEPEDSGVFAIRWDAMDGIKGTFKKGSRSLEKLAVVWRFADTADGAKADPTTEVDTATATAATGVQNEGQIQAADWQGTAVAAQGAQAEKDLGLRVQSPASADISRASSMLSADLPRYQRKDPSEAANEDGAVLDSVKTSGPSGEELDDDVHKS